MVIYDLICDSGHKFEGWFKSSDELSSQISSGLLSCPSCASVQIAKTVTAAKIGRKSNTKQPIASGRVSQDVVHSDPASPEKYAQLQDMLKKMHDYVDKNFEDVGNKFAEQAINMHRGDEEQSNIRGTATAEEIKEMANEGVQALPLPPKPIDPKKLN